MLESKLVALILYISIDYDRGYLGVRIWLPTPHRIFTALLRQISYLPHFRTLAAPGLSHPPRRISRGRRKICCDPPFPKLLRVAPFKSEFALV